MTRGTHRYLVVLIGLAFLSPSTMAWAESIRWAGSVSPALPDVLGPPDGRPIGLGSSPVTLGDFGPALSHGGLAALLGLPEAALSRTDVIGFEYNGASPAPSGGWESSTWTFSDGSGSRTVLFNETTGTFDAGSAVDVVLVANGSISDASYNAFFRITPSLSNSVISYMLFDLPSGLNTESPSFTLAVAGRPGVGEGTPDPDAIGVFQVVPEAGGLGPMATAALSGVGLLLFRRKGG